MRSCLAALVASALILTTDSTAAQHLEVASFGITTPSGWSSQSADGAAGRDGRIVIVWDQFQEGDHGPLPREIGIQRFSPGGVALAPALRLPVSAGVTFTCANEPKESTRKDPGQEDYRISAVVVARELGAGDAHPDDDACPRQVTPPGVVDAYPDGKIFDKGCGTKKADKTFGDPVLVDVVVK